EVKDGRVKIAVAYTGQQFKKGEQHFTISLSDLHKIASHIVEREVPLDYEHLSARDDVPPGYTRAAGWIKPEPPPEIHKLSDGRSMLWAWCEPTPALAAAIHANEFKYASPEIHWNSPDEHGKNPSTRLK